jgi:DNA-binding LacI/PurR family transcriptional regulator
MARVTISDIAARTGVSPTTVSMVLSNKGKISESVKQRVQAAAQALGYSRLKRKLGAHNANADSSVGILIAIDSDWEYAWRFIRSIIANIEAVLRSNGFRLLMIPFHSTDGSDEILESVLASQVRALFSLHCANEALFSRLEQLQKPVVVVNNSNLQHEFSTVCVDDISGAYHGTISLIENGHREIAYVEYDRPDMQALIMERFMGFKNALDNRGIPFPEGRRITTFHNDMAMFSQNMRSLFEDHPGITAIFSHDDYLALDVIAVLRKLGKTVPDDVSIIAPGDVLNYGEPHVPRISTMKINTDYMGKAAGELMLSRIRKEIQGIHVLKVNQELVDRGSVKSIGTAD